MASVNNAAHLAVSELESDILDALRSDELSKLPSLRLLRSQPHVSCEMRPQLLDFMAQTQAALELRTETLALAVSILDRYMSRRIVYGHHYQLLGCVSLWLAAKTVDDKHRVPTTGTLAYLCADTYAESMFKEMELHVLSTLEWAVLAPTSFDYVDGDVGAVAFALGSPEFSMVEYHTIRNMARYVCECCLFSQEMATMRPSMVAATAVAFSSMVVDVLESRGWPPAYPEGCAKECFDALVVVIANPPSECAARYAGRAQCSASQIFAKFFSGLKSEYDSDDGVAEQDASLFGPMQTGSRAYNTEPCTPTRARQTSQTTVSTSSPFDDDLISPPNSTVSPNTFFVPLTPDELYSVHAQSQTQQDKRVDGDAALYYSSNQSL